MHSPMVMNTDGNEHEAKFHETCFELHASAQG